MKSVVSELNAQHASSSRALSISFFGGSKPPQEALPDLYYQPKVLSFLAEQVPPRPPHHT